ncbi:MAG: hypothetical protein OXB88_07085 [Bacteriovoracales bacterium]|nr:hypothetical protein [Bacteriovoracales bacterium]
MGAPKYRQRLFPSKNTSVKNDERVRDKKIIALYSKKISERIKNDPSWAKKAASVIEKMLSKGRSRK